MKTIKERIQFAHQGGLVTRFHQHAGHRLNTDAQHSHGVAMMTLFLSEGLPSNTLLLAALTHDLAEQCTGDVPFPTKRAVPGLKEQLDSMELAHLRAHDLEFPLTEEERRILNLADSLDGILYCASEVALGNRTLHGVYKRWEALVLYGGTNVTEIETIVAVLTIYKESCDGQTYDALNGGF
jgi:5'-deoxynucleotidase YfbR-like HD superfamily hydrolase